MLALHQTPYSGLILCRSLGPRRAHDQGKGGFLQIPPPQFTTHRPITPPPHHPATPPPHHRTWVGIPIGFWFFESMYTDELSPNYFRPVHHALDAEHPLTIIIQKANEAGLAVILALAPIIPDNGASSTHLLEDTARAVGEYVEHLKTTLALNTVIAFELPPPDPRNLKVFNKI